MDPVGPNDPATVGPYEILGRLGSGGMGVVYLAREAGDELVAVKLVHPQLASDQEFRARFKREVITARMVGGRYTVPVIDSDANAQQPWLATAYIPGLTLAQTIDVHGPLPEESVRTLALGLADALASIHAVGLVHRDVKPSNVILASDGPRVIDFGIAKNVQSDTRLTRTGLSVGTIGYVAPEVLEGQQAGPAADVFALGVVLAFAATGAHPFADDGTMAGIVRILTTAPNLDGVPASLHATIEGCLRKQPAERSRLTDVVSGLSGRSTERPEGTAWLPQSVQTSILQSGPLPPNVPLPPKVVAAPALPATANGTEPPKVYANLADAYPQQAAPPAADSVKVYANLADAYSPPQQPSAYETPEAPVSSYQNPSDPNDPYANPSTPPGGYLNPSAPPYGNSSGPPQSPYGNPSGPPQSPYGNPSGPPQGPYANPSAPPAYQQPYVNPPVYEQPYVNPPAYEQPYANPQAYEQPAAYPQPGYGPPPVAGYGTPPPSYPGGGYPAAAPPPPPRKGVSPLVPIVIILAVLLVVAAGTAVAFGLKGNKDDPTPTPGPTIASDPVKLTPTPSPTESPSSDSSSAALVGGDLTLYNKVDTTGFRSDSCTTASTRLSGTVGHIECRGTGLAYDVQFAEFSSAAELKSFYATEKKYVTSTKANGKCGTDAVDSTWQNSGGTEQGTLICFFDKDKDYWIVWGYDSQYIVGFVIDETPAQAQTWWETNGNFLK